MECPYLDYRKTDGELDFQYERPYCEIIDSFVSPMRADICNNRHGTTHENYCEIYRDNEDTREFPEQESIITK